MSCPIIVCIRHTTNWESMSDSDLVYPEIWQPEGITVHDGMSLWREMTNADYFSVRGVLKRISSTNWMAIKNLTMLVDITHVDVGRFISNLNGMFDNYMLLPTDDDDWFSSEIYNSIVPSIKGADCVRWNSARYDCIKRGEVFYKDNSVYPENNSYSITKQGINKLTPVLQDLILKNHLKLNNIIYENDLKTVFLPNCLSIYNYHHASISYLMLSSKDRDLLKNVKWKYERFPELDDQTRWAAPYIKEFSSYMNQNVVPRVSLFL